MTPDIPVLMITLQIPVEPDTSAEQVLDAIGQKVAEALAEIKQEAIKQQTLTADPEAIPQEEFNRWVLKETEESYSDTTGEDKLATLGYAYTS